MEGGALRPSLCIYLFNVIMMEIYFNPLTYFERKCFIKKQAHILKGVRRLSGGKPKIDLYCLFWVDSEIPEL